MPTDYEKGFLAGMRFAAKEIESDLRSGRAGLGSELPKNTPKPKRKLSAWNKYVKANSKKPRFRLRSGKINLKKMGVAFRKTPAGKKK